MNKKQGRPLKEGPINIRVCMSIDPEVRQMAQELATLNEKSMSRMYSDYIIAEFKKRNSKNKTKKALTNVRFFF